MNLCELFPSNLPIFPRLITVQEIESKTRPIASEKATEMFINTCIEDPVRETINKLRAALTRPKWQHLSDGRDLDFIYHPKNFDDNPGRVLGPERAPEDTISVRDKDFRPDGFQKSWGISQHAWKQVRHALIQAYDYMIRSLTEFGVLTTGRVIVFLRIDWASAAQKLYYHLARPAHDVAQAPEEDAAFLSTVGQYVSFVVMALRESRYVDQESRIVTRTTIQKANAGSTTRAKDAAVAST
ncbi:hypothetical protein E4U28_007902 [Claviceps purpurea]|nr:hypothetical protein E4U28_007902 [Claviceps purpurea]